MRIGYIRASRQENSTDMQMIALKHFNIEKLFEEKNAGKEDSNPRLQALLDFVRAGDIVYVESIARLARSALEFLELVAQFGKKDVQLVCIKERIDSATAEGQYLFSVFAALRQLESEAAKERRQEGIDEALAGNKPYGRPKIPINENFISVYERWKAGEITAVQAMQLSGLKKNTFYSRVKEYEQTRTSKRFNWGIRIN